ncbi:MAG: hypothetical protein K6T91_10500 [Firmicutes bacterium]|nr:hypothetical protein [Bacillota bacterium]
MRRKIAAIFVATIAFLSILSQPISARSNNKVVFILMDNISWSDIISANDRIINDLIERSSIGLLNNRAYKASSRPRSALTVGAGVRADGASSNFEGFNADEPYGYGLAMDVFRQRTGKRAKKGQVLELGIAPIIRDNMNGMQDLVPGGLGKIINKSGKKTAVLGNSDTGVDDDPSTCNREAVDIAMNSNGVVDFGDVSKDIIARDSSYPFGVRTDYKKLAEIFKKAFSEADFIVVDLGDTTRADLYGQYAFKRITQQQKTRAIHTGAKFIKQAMEIAGEDTTFIIASISPPGSSKSPLKSDLEQLTPIIVHGPGFKPSALVSSSTQREGIVTTVDIAPTVLSILGLQKGAEMTGSLMHSSQASLSPLDLEKFNLSAVGVKDTRRTAILAYIYIQVALYAITALVLAFGKKLNKYSAAVLETLIFMTMGFPLFSFYTTKLEQIANQGFLITMLTIAASLAFAVLLVATRRKVLHPIAGISVLTLTVLLVDALVGAPSYVNSIFGYDPIRGSRFFGVGNEAMSILIANTLLVFGVMLERTWNRWTVLAGAILCLIVTLIIGFPTIGANTGGTIAAVFAFTAMLLQAMKSKAKVRNVVISLALVVTVLSIFVAYDVMHGAQTHMGKTIASISSGGLHEVIVIANRKLATNLMVLRFSTWSYFLLTVLGILTFLWFRPVGVLRDLLANYKGISIAITASLIGGIFGFSFNDSGVLIPAIIMSYMIPTVIYLMFWERYHASGKPEAN